jgi:hypothetical protein
MDDLLCRELRPFSAVRVRDLIVWYSVFRGSVGDLKVCLIDSVDCGAVSGMYTGSTSDVIRRALEVPLVVQSKLNSGPLS